MKIKLVVVLLASCVAPACFAAPRSTKQKAHTIYEVKPGSRERRQIFAALRPAVQKQMKMQVLFVGSLKANKSGWAAFMGNARRNDGTPEGKPLGAEGMWGEMAALMRRTNGKWRVLSYGFSTGTDAIDEALRKYPQAPRKLFYGE
jgi:hypothetical protein